jgi:hypothetical protein
MTMKIGGADPFAPRTGRRHERGSRSEVRA